MSEHIIAIVPIALLPHPDADSLSIVYIEGYSVVCKTMDWEGIDRGIYIPPDFLVKTSRPEFKFLDDGKGTGEVRIKVKKLRGVLSEGLLIPVPPDLSSLPIGTNVLEALEIKRWVPEESANTKGECIGAPSISPPCYDVEGYHKYVSCFAEGEEVVATEKIHGSNGRFVFDGNRMYCGSHYQWKKEDPTNLWWQCLAQNPWIEVFCKNHPNHTLYGEVYGKTKNFKYGAEGNEVKFAVFDILTPTKEWMSFDLAHEMGYNLQWVPLIYRGPFELEKLKELATGNSIVPKAQNIREGVVVKPITERSERKLGRVQVKFINPKYYEKS